MTIHLVKLCVGATSIEDLQHWQKSVRRYKTRNGKACAFHTTFQTPKRAGELLDGGSLYWVIKGMILARQRLTGLEDGKKEDGSACCLLLLDPEIVAVRPVPRRAFQGWRYLDAADAPADISGKQSAMTAMPLDLRRELAALGLV